MKTRSIVPGVCLVLSMSMAAYAQKVDVDFDKAAPFSTFKTFAWTEGTPAKNPLMGDRITNSINLQLAAKGLLKVDRNNNPDLLVSYHAATDMETPIYPTGGGWSYWGGPNGGSKTTASVEKIPAGMLGVNIGTTKEKKYVWTGRASETLNDKPEHMEKTITKAVEKMFKDYPPKVK